MNRTPRLHGTKRTVIKALLAVGGSCWSRQSCSLRLLHDRSAHQITSSRNTSSTDRRTRAPRQLARVVLRLLVVVVAIATPTARLEVHADGAALTRVPIMYLAIWLVWTSFMLYANVAGDSTHRRAMLLAMGCIAVIAAAVPAADDFRRGQVFAVAYVVARVIASRTWQTTARVWSTGPPPSSPSDRCPGSSRSGSEPVRYYLWAPARSWTPLFAIGLANNPQAVLRRVQRDYDRAGQQRRPKTHSGGVRHQQTSVHTFPVGCRPERSRWWSALRCCSARPMRTSTGPPT